MISVFTHGWSAEKLQRFDYLCRTLFEVESEFIKIDLASDDPRVTEFKSLMTEAEFVGVMRYQCSKIRELRRAAYKEIADPLYMAHVADGDSLVLFRAARESIKAMYPWPGEYR